MAEKATRVLAIRHIAVEHLGALEPLWMAAGASITYLDIAAGGKLPSSHDAYDLLAILGGPMSVNDEDKLDWLRPEKRFVRDAIARGKPTLGLCLGAQMIASSLSARVAPGERHEVGFMEIDIADAAASDPLMREFHRPHQLVFQLHGEGFELPAGAVRLASSARYPNQAFRLGDRCWGFQFHVETDRSMVRQWVREYWGEPEQLAPDASARTILADAETKTEELARLVRPVAAALIEIARNAARPLAGG